MENNEKVIENVVEVKEETGIEINLVNTAMVATFGAIKPFANAPVYYIGLGAGLLFGKKAGLKAMGTYIGANAIYNTARFVTGEFNKKD